MDTDKSRSAILVGGGRVGRRVGRQLAEAGYAVTIIEQDEAKAERIPDPLMSRVLVADGRDEDVIREVDPSTADVVAALTNDTATNLAVCELASELAPEVGTLLRISEDGEQDYAYLEHVDNVVYPAAAGASVAVAQVRDAESERVASSGLP